jgi:hypothetical protein
MYPTATHKHQFSGILAGVTSCCEMHSITGAVLLLMYFLAWQRYWVYAAVGQACARAARHPDMAPGHLG